LQCLTAMLLSTYDKCKTNSTPYYTFPLQWKYAWSLISTANSHLSPLPLLSLQTQRPRLNWTGLTKSLGLLFSHSAPFYFSLIHSTYVLMNRSIKQTKESQWPKTKPWIWGFQYKVSSWKNIILPSGLFTNMRAFAAATSAIPACSWNWQNLRQSVNEIFPHLLEYRCCYFQRWRVFNTAEVSSSHPSSSSNISPK
jgi:hypothetical protein